MDYNKLASMIDDEDFATFLEDVISQTDNNSKLTRYNRNRRLDITLAHHTDVIVLETYLMMAKMFDEYPQLTGVKPNWSVEVDRDNNLMVIFKLDLKYQDEGKTVKTTAGYDQCPPSLGNFEPFDDAIMAGENIMAEHWNLLINFDIFTRVDEYKSKQDVIAEMNSSLSYCLPRIKKWALEKIALPAKRKSGPKSKM